MKKVLLRKLLSCVIVVFLISIVIFMIIHMLPGDPALLIAGTDALPEEIEAIRVRLGLNYPLHIQYLNWIKGILTGNMGTSLMDGRDIAKQIGERLPRTLLLCLPAMFFSLCIAVPMAVKSAAKHNTFTDLAISSGSMVLLSVPVFWFGILLLILFSVKLKWLPSGGWTEPSKDFGLFIKKLILPMFTMSIGLAPASIRLIRGSMLDVLNEDYIMLAQTKGNPPKRVNYVHALRNSLIPVSTNICQNIAHSVAGSIILEKTFQYPGMGYLLMSAIQSRDYPVIQAILLVLSLIIVGVNFLTDFIYVLIDPRIRLS